MFAENFEDQPAEKENQACRLIKIKFAVCRIFKQILRKDTKVAESNNNNNKSFKQQFQDSGEYGHKCSLGNEIEQNQANERLLKASQQQQKPTYVLAIETTVGSFYWDWECGMQRDSFADFNFPYID